MSMLDLIKENAVPANVMRTAARGALSVSAAEMIAILVYLSERPLFAQEARMTLARWDETSAKEVLSRSETPYEVLEYFWAPENRRPSLMPVLIENPAIPEEDLIALALSASHEIISMMLASERVQRLPEVLQTLLENPRLVPLEAHQVREKLGLENASSPDEPPDQESEAAHQSFTQEHHAEIAAEEGKPFELTGGAEDLETVQPPTAAAPQPAPEPMPAPARATVPARDPYLARKTTTLQKISRMTVADRIKTAFLGSKEERSILIRDGARLVQSAVLSSPKLSEPEVESFASAKNVQENVFREIARSRRFMKSYPIVRALVNNPKCPLDISLTLIKNLIVSDLKTLQSSKSIPDTLRKVAFKLYKEKSATPGQR